MCQPRLCGPRPRPVGGQAPSRLGAAAWTPSPHGSCLGTGTSTGQR
jgi:hypothetical protein